MNVGTPGRSQALRVLLLGSGELGKEVAIELMRLGAEVVACDRYADAPAMQVAHRAHVFDMLDPAALRAVVLRENPAVIVPEIEALATDALVTLEAEGFRVTPTAEAAKLTMDREGIRRLAAEELGLPTARYRFAATFAELKAAADALGYPCVVKPLMSSSGKGQSVARTPADLEATWRVSQEGGRTGPGRVIVEEFVRFSSEITVLTVRAVNGTFFCDPVGHVQKDGDYIESWQPHPMTSAQWEEAQAIAAKVTARLGGHGVFGVELFLLEDGRVLFSEVSPRPHDTGMVTMITQQWSQFALHARALMGLPIAGILRYREGASAAFKSPSDGTIANPVFTGVESVFAERETDLRIFGKPVATPHRRMAVVLASGAEWQDALRRAKAGVAKLGLVEGKAP